MKKAISIGFVAILVFSVVSCKTTRNEVSDQYQEQRQEQQYRDVYETYRAGLILDDAEIYIVQRGDTLTRIARKKYGRGNAYYYPLILLASNRTLEDPDLIEIGMELTIPNLETNLADPQARPQIKEFLIAIAEIYARTDKPWSVEHNEQLLLLANNL